MRPVIVTAALAATLMAFGACGGDDTPDTPEARAAQLAEELGCASCHGPQGQGGFGPPLAGLVGSTVELADGTSVVADQAYIETSILQPQAQIVAGFTVPMPAANPSAEQLADLLVWIDSLQGA